MKKNLFLHAITLIIFFSPFQITANSPEYLEQRPRTDANIFGHVLNAETGEHLPFVNLIIKGTRIGTMTDATGHYMLTNLPEGIHRLVIQSMGYETREVEFEIQAKQTLEVDVEVHPSAIRLQEIVLTASPTASGFRYQPDAVLMGEALQRRGEASFGEMLNGQPGVAMRSFGSAPARPVIRGLDGDRILVLENGERMGDISETSADHAISLDPLAASRVEIVRGPASLLYGSSALGGVINLMTTDIPEDWDAGPTGVVSLQGASVNNMGAGFGRINYGSDLWAVSARLAFRQAGDISTPDGILPGTSMSNYDGALGWGINRGGLQGGISASFSAQAFEIPDAIDDPDEKVEIRAQRQSLQGRFGRALQGNFFDQAQWRFNMARFFQQELAVDILDDGSQYDDVALEYEQYSVNTTLTLQHAPRGIFDRGAFGASFQGRQVQVGGDEAYTPGEQRFTLGMFTFQEIPLSNMLRLQAGVRLDLQNISAISNEQFPGVDLSRNSVNYSGSLGINYRPFENLEVGAQLARSHRNPQVEELFANGPHLGAGVYEIGDPGLRDEIGHGADLFVRFNGERSTIEIAGFVNYFRNFIIFQPTGETDEASGYPIFRYEGDEAQLMGGEISFNTALSSRLNLTMGMDYVFGLRFENGQRGEHLPMMPPLRFNTELEYHFNRMWIGSNIRRVWGQNLVAPEEDTTPGYNLLGFQAGYRFNGGGRHVVVLRMDNALNTRYRDHLSRVEDRNFPMPGRNVNLAYRWFF